MRINIIGDIAGRYDELMLLLNKMPEADLVIAVGDLVDRGPKSKQVIEWFMANQDKAIAIYGNHEDMMVNYCKDPDEWQNRSMWLHNGGKATLKSYENEKGFADVPVEVIEWLEKCPTWWKNDQLLVSHCPILGDMEAGDLPDPLDHNQHYFIWNRIPPYKRENYSLFHVYGHNGEHREHSDDMGTYATCIDNSFRGELMGMSWPSKEIFRQSYLPVGETLEERAKAEQREMTDEEKRQMEFLRSLNN